MFVDRHLYGGRLNYLLFGRWVEAAKSWLHRKTAPAPASPATAENGDTDSEPVEDVALYRSYQYVPPPTPEQPAPEPPNPPEAERKADDVTQATTPPPALKQPAPEPPEQPATDAPREPTAERLAEPAPSTEYDGYDEDEEYLRHMENVEYEPQPGAVDADELIVLLSVFSKGKSATEQEIATARRTMRVVSGSEIERIILDQLNGKDGYVAVMLDMITKELDKEDDVPPHKHTQSDRAFRLEDYV